VLAIAFLAGFPMMAASSPDFAVLSGRVTDTDGRPLAMTFINVTDGHGRTLGSTHSGDDGSYQVQVTMAPTYNVWAGKTDKYLFHYIPEARNAQNLRADFRLRLGGNIILTAYDPGGKRLNNGEFRQIAAARVFMTDLSDKPLLGMFAAIHSDISNWQWDKAWPAAIVVPGQRYKLLVQWELPGVGKLLFTLDSGGTGYWVDDAGGSIELDLNHEIARSSLAALRHEEPVADIAAAILQSDSDLRAGESAMAANPPDTAGAARAFAASVRGSLAAHEQLVLANTATDIERYRKGDAEVTVVGPDGAPLTGVMVTFQQTANDFAFGANPLGRNGSYDPRLADTMRKAGVNQSYVTARWGRIERSPNEYDWSNIDSWQHPADQQRAGYSLLGALSLWFTPNNDFWPGFLRTASFADQRDAVSRYAQAIAQRYAGSIDIWE
jgi:hypothetical protein